MKQAKNLGKATLDVAPDPTGRDGAIDFAGKSAGGAVPERGSEAEDARFARVMGAAAIDIWGDLPQEIQERLFERAVVLGHVGEQDEMLREQLAKYLHDHHKRTAHRD